MCGLCGGVNTGQFLLHSSDQCKVCRPSDVIVCDVISQAFPHHFGLLQATYTLKPEKAQEPGCAFCLQCTLSTQLSLLARLCHLLLPQTPTVVPILGNLLLLMEYLDAALPQTATQIKTCRTNKNAVLTQVQRFVHHGQPSQEPKGGVQQNWKELSVLDGCVL